MKRIIVSLCIAAAVLLGATLETRYVSRSADRFCAELSEMENLLNDGNDKAAARLCAKLEREWNDASKGFNILLIHDYVDSVGTGIAKMRVCLENGSRDGFFTESAGAKKALASIKGSEYPLLENIL